MLYIRLYYSYAAIKGHSTGLGRNGMPTKEVAKRLGLSEKYIRSLARRGTLKARKLGRDWIVFDLTRQGRLKNKKK
tara:strand:- start:3161 stop:3388 length:228 start_codon:yes stop_codon:yes gene_type:complete